MYDAIVVGARCAGSPNAMLLAQRGYKVLLLDKATSRVTSFRPISSFPPAWSSWRSGVCLRRSPRQVALRS